MTSTIQMITIMSIMMVINIGLVMVQGGIIEVNPFGEQFFNASASPYARYAGTDSILVDSSYLPSDDGVEADSSGNIFSDTYKSIKAWVQQQLAPLDFIGSLFYQPFGFLKTIGIPISICLAIGVLWYILALIILVSWWMGR